MLAARARADVPDQATGVLVRARARAWIRVKVCVKLQDRVKMKAGAKVRFTLGGSESWAYRVLCGRLQCPNDGHDST